MLTKFKKNLIIKILISYFGVIPFILVLLDISIFNKFEYIYLREFIFYYTLIIFTFIGSIRWNTLNIENIYEILAGFLPSLVSVFLIFFYVMEFNRKLIFLLLMVFILIQLVGDYFFYKNNNLERIFFIKIRLPLTLVITFNLFYFISV